MYSHNNTHQRIDYQESQSTRLVPDVSEHSNLKESFFTEVAKLISKNVEHALIDST